MTLDAVRADITTLAVDAIVNAANPALRRGAGVCGAIFAAAGPELDDACAALDGCATGDAVVTPGFALPASWIVHTVGPVWQGGDRGEPEALASCYRRSLDVAAEVGATSLAFPAISTGVYGYPPTEATEIAVSTAASRGAELGIDVVLVAFDDATYRRYEARLG